MEKIKNIKLTDKTDKKNEELIFLNYTDLFI